MDTQPEVTFTVHILLDFYFSPQPVVATVCDWGSLLGDGEKKGKCSFVILSVDNQVPLSSHFISGHIVVTTRGL